MVRKAGCAYRQRRIIGAVLIILLVLTAGWIFFRVGRPMLRLVSQPDIFRDWVEARGVWGRLAYAGMVILQVLIALIPGEPLEIAGGYAFGALEGTLLCLGAATLGSLAVFALVRRFGLRLAELFFTREKLRSLRFLQRNRRRDYLFMAIFMLPGTPKDLLCYFAGLTDMKLGTWMLICSLGRIPSVVTSTIGGNALGTESYLFAVAIFAITLVLSIVGMLAYQQIQKRLETRKAGKAGRE